MIKFALLIASMCIVFTFAGQFSCEGLCGHDAECTVGPRCPETCGVDHAGNHKCMARNLVPGCFCKNPAQILADGFSNRCINREECTFPKQCKSGENRTFNACGSACGDLKCNGEHEREICTLQCVPRCECSPNHRLNDNGQCVHVSDC